MHISTQTHTHTQASTQAHSNNKLKFKLIEDIQDKHKLKLFTATKITMQKMLKGIRYTKWEERKSLNESTGKT